MTTATMMKASVPSVETLRKQVKDHNLAYAIWPNEKPSHLPLEDVGDDVDEDTISLMMSEGSVPPLLIDVNTANLVLKVYDAVRPDLREKVSRMISASRGNFLKIADLAWNQAR